MLVCSSGPRGLNDVPLFRLLLPVAADHVVFAGAALVAAVVATSPPGPMQKSLLERLDKIQPYSVFNIAARKSSMLLRKELKEWLKEATGHYEWTLGEWPVHLRLFLADVETGLPVLLSFAQDSSLSLLDILHASLCWPEFAEVPLVSFCDVPRSLCDASFFLPPRILALILSPPPFLIIFSETDWGGFSLFRNFHDQALLKKVVSPSLEFRTRNFSARASSLGLLSVMILTLSILSLNQT